VKQHRHIRHRNIQKKNYFQTSRGSLRYCTNKNIGDQEYLNGQLEYKHVTNSLHRKTTLTVRTLTIPLTHSKIWFLIE